MVHHALAYSSEPRSCSAGSCFAHRHPIGGYHQPPCSPKDYDHEADGGRSHGLLDGFGVLVERIRIQKSRADEKLDHQEEVVGY